MCRHWARFTSISCIRLVFWTRLCKIDRDAKVKLRMTKESAPAKKEVFTNLEFICCLSLCANDNNAISCRFGRFIVIDCRLLFFSFQMKEAKKSTLNRWTRTDAYFVVARRAVKTKNCIVVASFVFASSKAEQWKKRTKKKSPRQFHSFDVSLFSFLVFILWSLNGSIKHTEPNQMWSQRKIK